MGRKCMGAGSNKLQALNIAQAVDNQITRWISEGKPVEIDKLRSIVRQMKEKSLVAVVEKGQLLDLWSEYVDFHVKLQVWQQTYIYTHIQTVGNLVKKCPHQNIEDKLKIFNWFLASKKRSVSTSKARFKLVVAALDWASKQGLIPRSYGIEYRDLLSSLSTKKSINQKENDETFLDIEIFKVKEIYSILEAFSSERFSRFKGKHKQYYNFVYFLWLTGCRPSEAVALKWENVDLAKKRLVFREAEVRTSGKIIKKKGTKTEFSRIFPINSELMELLKNVKTQKGYVFLRDDGKPVCTQTLRRIFYTVLEGLSLRKRKLYQLRHTMISYHANNDFPIHKLAELVGNSEDVIKSYYLQLDIERIALPDVIKSSEVA